MTQGAKAAVSTARILLAGNNADTRNLLKPLLSQRYDVEIVADGVAGLTAVHRIKPLPDLVLTDILSTGLNGFEVLRSLRADPQTKELPIILLSTQAEEEACIAGLEAGADDYVTKPFSGRQLLARIEANLRRVRLRQEAVCREQELGTQSVAAQKKAEATRDQISNILESITDAFVAFDRHWCYTYVNDQATRLLHKTREELLGRHVWKEVFPETVGTLAYQEFHRAITEQIAVVFEEFGQPIGKWLEIHAYPSPDGLAVYFRDITERKQAEEALRRREAELTLIANALPVLISFVDSEQRYRFNNREYEEWLGHPATEVYGKHLREVLGESAYEAIRPYIEQVLAGEQVTYESPITYKNGETRYIRAAYVPQFDSQGNVEGFVGLVSDISEVYRQATLRKRMEMQLQRSNERFELAAAAVNCLIYDWDIEQDTVERTEGLTRILGYSLAEAQSKGTWWRERVHPEDLQRIQDEAAVILATSDRYTAEYRVRNKDNQYIHVLDQGIVAARNADGHPVRVVGSTTDISERKRSEEALRQSEERFQAFMNNSPAAAWITDANGRLVYLSQTYFRLFEFPTDDVIGKSIFELYPAEIAQEFLDNIKTVAQTNQAIEAIEAAPRPDGTIGDFLVYKFPVADASGQRLVGGVAIDITDRKQAEEALRASEERFRVIVNQATAGIMQVDLTGRFLLVNQRYCDIVGYSMAELLQKRMQDITHPDDLPRNVEFFQRMVAQAGNDFMIEKRYIRKDGSEVWVSKSVSAAYDISGKPQDVIAVVLDVTDRKRAEAERAQLLAREQQYTCRLQKLAEASLTINSTLSLNERLQLITDQARDIIEAHQSVSSLTVDENWAQAIHAVSLSEKYAQWREYGEKSDGSGIYTLVCRMQRPIRMTQAELEAHPDWRGFGKEAGSHPPMRGWLAAPLTNSNGKNIGLIQLSDKYEGEFTQEDESILVQLAQMASAAIDNARLYEESQQANRLKDEFLAVLSHELRSPLNPILGWSKLLRSRKLDEKTTERALETIERSAQIQTQLIEDLLDVSRILQGKLSLNVRSVDLIFTIQAAMETVHLAAEAKSIQIQTRFEPNVGQVSGDPSRLQQVIWNLLSNAVKFTPPGGRVDIHLSVVSGQWSVAMDNGQRTTDY